MDYLWAGMILAGILYGTFTGRSEALTKDLLDAAGEAISLCITMAGVLSFWMGLMKVGERAGLLQKMTKGIQPLVDFLFPDIPQEHASRMHISPIWLPMYWDWGGPVHLPGLRPWRNWQSWRKSEEQK